MHLYFGGFFALAGLVAIGALGVFAGPELQNVRRAHISLAAAWFCVLLTTLISPAPPTVHYKGAIVFCTLAMGFAVAFYRFIPGPHAIAAWLVMLVGGVLFFTFTARTAFALPSPLVILVPVLAIWAYFRFVPAPRAELRPDIIAFLAVWGMAAWQAIELWWQHGTIWSLLAMLGMLALIGAPFAHGQSRQQFRQQSMRQPLQQPPALCFYTYAVGAALFANWLLALSTWTVFDRWV